ncbi:MAG: molybdopterin-dependent oxidoreductase [Actinobacteria bacterium]|nr:molybdopterin-dependent oxidoreductase [Actinomycetota bacterium]
MRKISRRDFLKLSAAGTAVLAIESQLNPLAEAMELMTGGRSVNRTSHLPRSFLPSTCTQCPAGCGIMGYVEESRLVKIGGNPKHINNQGTLCARGQAGINALYDPDRILKPLKRAGGRGKNRWTTIDWRQAYDEVAKTMQQIRSNPAQFVYLTEDLRQDMLGRRFTNAFGSPNAIGAAAIFDANKKVATELTWGAAGDMPDVARTKYALIFGANPMESHPQFVGFVRRLVDGIQQNQAKVVTFDVRLTNTSALAKEAYYVNPGTYSMLALSMANIIMSEGLQDSGFINQWTNVSERDLAAHLAQFTAEKAEKETGVAANVIRRIATEFARTKPATTVSDGMASSHLNGTQNERAIMLLNVITGNVDIRGGLCLPRQYDLADASPVPPAPVASSLSQPAELPLAGQQSIERSLQMIQDRKYPVGVLMSHGYNPVYSNPDGDAFAEALKDDSLIPYHVAVTPYMTETAALADIILPETTYLEGWDIEARPSPEQVPYVALRQPVVPPLQDSKSFFDIATELSTRVAGGMESYFNFKSVEDYIDARIAGISGLMSAGGLNYLKQYGIWYDPKSKPDYGAYATGGFQTPSGKIEVSSPRLEQQGYSALPNYDPVPAFNNLSKDELVLTIYDTAIQSDAKTANCMWLDEILHDNPVLINPQTAASLGIKDGDKVTVVRTARTGDGVRSPGGTGVDAKARSVQTTAFITEGIHPRVVAMANGVGHTGFGRIAQGKKVDKSSVERVLRDPNTELVWWGEKDGTGVNPKKIVPVMPEPAGGGQAWGDVVVTVGKSSD